MQKIWIGIAVVLFALIVVVTLVIVLVDWRGHAEGLASTVLGRKVRFERLDFDLDLPSRIEIAGLRIANPAGDDGNLLTLDSIEVSVRPWSLLWGPVALPKISASGLRLNLARDDSGQGNWILGQVEDAAVEAVSPDTRAELPSLGRVAVSDALIAFDDAPSGIKIQARVDHLNASASPDDVAFDLKGGLAQQPLKVRFEGGALNTLRQTTKPYPVDLELEYGETEIAVKGKLSEPLALQGADLRINAMGPSLSELYPLLPTAVPATPPYQVNGLVVLKEKRWEVHDLRGNIGDTDISGWVAYQPRGDRPALLADLHSKKLVVEDLYAVVGKKDKDNKAQNKGLFPEARLTAERLQAMDFNVSYAAETIIYPPLPLERIKTHATLDDGRLLAKLGSLGIAGGEVSGEAALNARQAVPSADLDLKLRDVNLTPFFQDTQFADEMNGRVGGQLYLLGTGWTLADLLGSVQGNGRLHVQDASLSGLVLEAIGLDVIEALGLIIGDQDPKVPLRCGVVDFTASDGVIKIDRSLIDTADSVLTAGGQVNLKAETLAVKVGAEAKDFSLLDVEAPVVATGSLRNPEVSIGEIEGLPIELGTQDNLNCQQLLNEPLESAKNTKQES